MTWRKRSTLLSRPHGITIPATSVLIAPQWLLAPVSRRQDLGCNRTPAKSRFVRSLTNDHLLDKRISSFRYLPSSMRDRDSCRTVQECPDYFSDFPENEEYALPFLPNLKTDVVRQPAGRDSCWGAAAHSAQVVVSHHKAARFNKTQVAMESSAIDSSTEL